MTQISSLSHFSALDVFKIVSNVSQLNKRFLDHLLFTWEWWQRVEGGRTARPDSFSPSFLFLLLLRQLFLLHFSQLFTFLLSPSSLFLFHFPPNFSSPPTVCISVPQFYCIGQDLVKLELGEMGFPPFCHNLSPLRMFHFRHRPPPLFFQIVHVVLGLEVLIAIELFPQYPFFVILIKLNVEVQIFNHVFLTVSTVFFPISLSSLHFHLIFLPAPTSASTSQTSETLTPLLHLENK